MPTRRLLSRGRATSWASGSWPRSSRSGHKTAAVRLSIGAMPMALESTRLEWEEGHRRLEAAADDRTRYERMLADLEIVLDQLRRHVGETFTLAQLADAYPNADRWVQEVLAESGALPGWPAR